MSLFVQANDSTIVLDPVTYGTSGQWAINIWMKPGSLYGSNFQYMFSHAQNKFYQTGWESNQASPWQQALLTSYKHDAAPREP
jgi:hypothetical protein